MPRDTILDGSTRRSPQRRDRSRLQSGIDRRSPPSTRSRKRLFAPIGGGIAILIALARRASVAMRRKRVAISAPGQCVERWMNGPAARGLADRHPDDARASSCRCCSKACASSSWSAHRIPVRNDLEPANRHSRRPGRIVRRVRVDPIVLGHDPHRRDHRHDRRHPAGPDGRDLPDAICGAKVALWSSSRSSEILAGVPTVVYGYFAALTVAPWIRDFGHGDRHQIRRAAKARWPRAW